MDDLSNFSESFKPGSKLGAATLKREIAAIIETLDPVQAESDTGLSAARIKSARSNSYTVRQKSGVAVEPIIVTFASKIAYEIWKQIILPKLKQKYGGSALLPMKRGPSAKRAASNRKVDPKH